MNFPVSGVEVNPLLAAFLISLLTAPAGVSGAFLLLPFQVSVLGFTSPAVSPTNLIYNVVATPGGAYRYVREGRVVWPLAWAVVLGTLPGVKRLRISVAQQLPNYRKWQDQTVSNDITEYHYGHLDMAHQELELMVAQGQDALETAGTAIFEEGQGVDGVPGGRIGPLWAAIPNGLSSAPAPGPARTEPSSRERRRRSVRGGHFWKPG